MTVRVLESSFLVRRPLGEVFAFFADAGNLQRITPPWLNFEILTPLPIDMRAGALIDYRIRVRGLPVRWRTRIAAWEPPLRFVDEQLRGPYRLWHHEHTFEETSEGVLVKDRVRYRVPGWVLEPVIHRLWVRGDLDRIFAYRRSAIEAFFGAGAAPEAKAGVATAALPV